MLIINGHIKTMASEEYEYGYLHVEGNKIKEIGWGNPPDELLAQCVPDEIILDVKGALVMPGLIEAHCHMGITEEKKAKEGDDCNENVEPVTPFLRGIDGINPMDPAFDDAIRAGITSAMIGPGSANVVGGQFAMVKTRGRRIDDLIMKAPAAMKVAFGENPKVNYSSQDKMPVTRMAIAALLREELFAAKQYFESQKAVSSARKEEFRYECWIPVFNKEIPLKAHAHRVDDIYTAIRIAKEFDLDLTLDHCSEGHLIAEELAREGYPAIVGPDLTCRNKIEVQNMTFKTPGLLQKAGVLIAITTDHPVSQIAHLPLCAGLAVKAGLPMEEGYKAITINPAQICGVSHRVGSLEIGKDADIAIFDGNPMEVFTNTLYTIINGEIVYDAKDKYNPQ